MVASFEEMQEIFIMCKFFTADENVLILVA